MIRRRTRTLAEKLGRLEPGEQAKSTRDLTGQTFGRVTVVEATTGRSFDRQILWLCSDGKRRDASTLRKMARRVEQKKVCKP